MSDMMQTRFDARTPYSVLEREHQTLREALAKLRSGIASSDGVARFGDQIEAVRTSLAVHFAFEENFGSLHYLVATRPGLEPQLDELRADHTDILVALERVSARLAKGMTTTELGTALASLLDRLAEHELRQHQLVRRALLKPDPLAAAALAVPSRLRAAS